MATREDYRNDLKDKIVGLEDSGYGDFEYTDPEYNTYLELAVARLFPALYKRSSVTGLVPTSYGTNQYYEIDLSATPAPPDRVYLIENAVERNTLYGWRPRPTAIVNLEADGVSAVNVYYYEAYSMPADDVTDAGIPSEWTPLIVLGGLIEAMESRQDTGVRGDEPFPHGFQQVGLIDRLQRRYDALKAEMAMSLPGVAL